MTVSEKYNACIKSLSELYDEREARNIASWLIEDIVGLTVGRMVMDRYRLLTVDQHNRIDAAMQRLALHEPIQYVVGYAEFMGLKIQVNPAVLIPRPETEELVAWIVADMQLHNLPITMLDIGTGSGCIAVSVAVQYPLAAVTAVDVSSDALEVARLNADNHQVNISYQECDILTSLPSGLYQVIVSNPPYIGWDEMALMASNVTLHEPHLALFADEPTVFYKRIAAIGLELLLPNGCIYVEMSEYRANEIAHLFKSSGYDTLVKNDLYGKPRMLRASLTQSQ
jgi:release factor glutamine methyltransferase